MQTRSASLAEAVVNTVFGCMLGFAIVFLVLKLDFNPVSASVWAVALNIPASAARQYAVRRLFNGA
jgi:hypothetical protein